MNASELIKQLRPLTGNRIRILLDPSKDAWAMDCHAVMHLPRDERGDVEKGNVILFTGIRDKYGRPEGLVFWARDVLMVERRPNVFVLNPKGGWRAHLQIVGPIESRGQL